MRVKVSILAVLVILISFAAIFNVRTHRKSANLQAKNTRLHSGSSAKTAKAKVDYACQSDYEKLEFAKEEIFTVKLKPGKSVKFSISSKLVPGQAVDILQNPGGSLNTRIGRCVTVKNELRCSEIFPFSSDLTYCANLKLLDGKNLKTVLHLEFPSDAFEIKIPDLTKFNHKSDGPVVGMIFEDNPKLVSADLPGLKLEAPVIVWSSSEKNAKKVATIPSRVIFGASNDTPVFLAYYNKVGNRYLVELSKEKRPGVLNWVSEVDSIELEQYVIDKSPCPLFVAESVACSAPEHSTCKKLMTSPDKQLGAEDYYSNLEYGRGNLIQNRTGQWISVSVRKDEKDLPPMYFEVPTFLQLVTGYCD